MHSQSIRGPRDDMNLVNCDLTNSYKSCQPSEKFCRFAYASWCPVCDLDPQRRRSKSECIDYNYRKRGREMKSQSPKLKTTSEKVDYLDRIGSSRVRTNLCELPTTYINNCQTNVPSNDDDPPYSIKFSNFVETVCDIKTHPHQRLTNSIRNGDIIKNNSIPKYYVPAHKPEKTTGADLKTPNLTCNGKTKGNTIPCMSIKDQIIKVVKEQSDSLQTNNYTGFKERNSSHKQPTNHVCKEALQTNKTSCPRRHLPTPKSPIKQANPSKQIAEVKKPQTVEKAEVKGKEVVRVNNSPVKVVVKPETANSVQDSKRFRVRQRSESENQPVSNEKRETENCTVITKKAREISPLETKKELRSKSSVKVTSIKNRHKLSAIKLRKVRSKIAHSVSSDSNLSDSDFSESNDEEKIDEPDVIGDGCRGSNMDIKDGSTPIGNYTPVSTSSIKDVDKWPIRLSLFPHIPPYISFSSHDSQEFKMPEGASRYLKWRLSTITPVVVRKTLLNTGFRLVRSEYSRESNDWIGTWGKHIKSVCFQSLKENQKLNHFPGTFQIGRKDRLWKNLQRLMSKYGQKEFGFIPRTFVLPTDLKLLRQAWEKTGHERWIIKPPASARGTGIKVIHRWSHLPKKKSLVVQQYISNPYLINGSKFDLRLYVLVTSFNPLRIYLYPDGLARFASTKYSDDLNTLSDRYMHLTNYSINKLSSQYTANEDANACKGHKWTLSKLWEYLDKEGVNTKMLWKSLQQLVIKTILCGESSITQLYKANINSRYNCYEIFGIDVLLDERLKPWLLEVNISPSLHSASPLDLHVKGPIVQSLLNLAQFHLPPKMSKIKNCPPCLDLNLYSTQLTTKERLKHISFVEMESRTEYLNDILVNLTGDDVRHLTQAEDELTVIGNFERIFPTRHTHYYFQFMEPRYYNRLFDAWENRFEKSRNNGIKLLQSLCEKKLHLEVAPTPVKPSLKETSQESGPEESTSDESIRQEISKRPMTCPAPVTKEPTINLLKNDVRYKMMNLKLGINRPITPYY